MTDPREEAMWACERWLVNPPQTAAGLLRAAADALGPDARADRYGSGELVQAFEARIAELLGMEAAAVFPSGTMAQQIALRLHCDRRGERTVAFHPTCHLELWEHAGYAHLHGLVAELIGDRDRLVTLADLEGVGVPLGAVLLELPQREIGGLLPAWDDLVEQTSLVRARGAALHLDGARLWEAAAGYERPLAEVAGLFDTAYVSLYKGLGGMVGCVLAGPRDLITAARVWRRRHGGELFRMFPFVATALPGVESLLPRMPEILAHARALASALREVPGVRIVPDPPHTALFHVQLTGDAEAMQQRALEIAREQHVWLFRVLMPTPVAGVQMTELHLGESALAIAPDEAATLFARVVGS